MNARVKEHEEHVEQVLNGGADEHLDKILADDSKSPDEVKEAAQLRKEHLEHEAEKAETAAKLAKAHENLPDAEVEESEGVRSDQGPIEDPASVAVPEYDEEQTKRAIKNMVAKQPADRTIQELVNVYKTTSGVTPMPRGLSDEDVIKILEGLASSGDLQEVGQDSEGIATYEVTPAS